MKKSQSRKVWEPRVQVERNQKKAKVTAPSSEDSCPYFPIPPASLHPFRAEWSRKGISPQLQGTGKKLTSGRVAVGRGYSRGKNGRGHTGSEKQKPGNFPAMLG